MAQIVPTITTSDPNRYNMLIESFNNFSRRVQIDVSDGEFAPSILIPPTSIWWPKEWETDIHMMVAHPAQHLQVILKIHPSLCIFHAEASDNLQPIFTQLKTAGIRTGLALLKSTCPADVKDLITMVDHVLIFAGDLGKQGGTADMLQMEKVALIRAIKNDVEIGWDGGANTGNVRALSQAGVNVINVGSAITNAKEPTAMYQTLVTESEKKGVLL